MERKSERAGEKAKAHIGRSKLQPFRIGLTRTLASLYIPIAAVFSTTPNRKNQQVARGLASGLK